MTSRYWLLRQLGCLVALAALGSCTNEKVPEWTGPQSECAVDLDGDGYGPGCAKGDDCNDGDDRVAKGCAACAVPGPGCACAADSAPIECIEHGAIYEDTMLCRVGKRYCRDSKWSGCESITAFEVSVNRTRSVRSSSGFPDGSVEVRSAFQGLVTPGAATVCDVCSPACREIVDPVNDTMVALNDPNLTYTSPDGDGITLASELANPTDVTPNTACAMPCGMVACPMGSYDTDCDGVADDFEVLATCMAGDTACASAKPFTSSATGFTLTLAPGQGISQSLNLQFVTRTVDVYFMLDTATSSSTLIDAIKNNLTANAASMGTPFFFDSSTSLDTCATRGQGIIGDLKCLLNNPQVGIGFTRDVPFGTDAGGVKYGWDTIDQTAGTYDAANPFSDFLFEQIGIVSNNTASLSSQLGRLIVRADPDANGPNAQIQGLYTVASGNEQYVGYDRPAVPGGPSCAVGTFGYPCFRTASVPIVVMVTGKGMYNGPTLDYLGAAIAGAPGSYPSTLHSNKVNVGSFEGYIETRKSLATDFENFATAHNTTIATHPAGGTIGSVHNQLLTFTGDTSNMTADIDASFFGCSGAVPVVGPDAVHYIDVNSSVPGGTTNVFISSKGTRFPSLVALVKSDSTTPPTLTNSNLTEYCCPNPTPPAGTDCTLSPKPADCCLAASACGDTSANAYNVGTLSPGSAAVLTGQLTQAGNYPADVLECFARANAFQCGNGSKASDTAPDSVFKFNLSQDMSLNLWSQAAAFPTEMALFEGRPYGVDDIVLDHTAIPENYLPVSGNPLVLSNNAYRFVVSDTAYTGGDAGCAGFQIDGLDATYQDETVWQNATDMTPSDGNPACRNVAGDAVDMEFPFTITADNTEVSFQTSGQQPTGELKGSVAIAVREIAAPIAVEVTPPGATGASYDNWTTPPWPIPSASFTPPDANTNQFSALYSTIVGATSDLNDLNLATRYYDAYRCVADDVNLCNLSTARSQGSCLGTGIEEISDNWLNSTVDVMYSFTIPVDDPATAFINEGLRSLKIGAVGVNDAKHHLMLFDAAAINALPPVPDSAGTSVTETASSSSQTFTLEGTTSSQTFNLASSTSSQMAGTAGAGDEVTAPIALGTINEGVTLSVTGAGLNTDHASIDADYQAVGGMTCDNGESPTDQVLSFTAQVAAALTVTVTEGATYTSGRAPAVAVFADNAGVLGTQLGVCATGDTATVTGTTTAMTTYYVVVSGSRGNAKGTYSLSVALGARAGGDKTTTPAVSLGSVSAGTTINVSGTALTTNNTAIVTDYAATSGMSCDGGGDPPDQVFSFTAADTAALTVTATANVFAGGNPAVAVYADNGSGGLGTQLGTCATGSTATVTGVGVASTTYYVVVSGSVTAAKGTYTLSVGLAAPLGGNTIANPLALGSVGAGQTVSVSGTGLTTDNVAITPNYDVPTDYVSCNNGANAPPDQVLSFTASAAHPLTVTATANSFAGGNPAIAVYADNGAGGLGTQFGSCATGATAAVTGTPVAGQLYYVIVSGSVTAAKGTYTLQVSAPILHDTYATAHNLGTIDGTSAAVVNTTNQTGVNKDYGLTCNKNGTARYDQVHKFHVTSAAATRAEIIVTPSTAWEAIVQVQKVSNGAVVGCTGDTLSASTANRTISFAPEANTDYYVIVSGYDADGDRGGYTLTVRDVHNGNIGCDTSIAPTRAVVTVKDLPTGTYYVVLKMDIAAVALGVLNPEQVTLAIEDASWEEAYGTFFCELDNYQPYEAVEPHSVVGGSLLKRTQLDLKLDAGSYVAILKRATATGTGPGLIKFTMRDKAHQPDVYACHNTDFNGDGEAITQFTFAEVCEICVSTTDPNCVNTTSGLQCTTGATCRWLKANNCRDAAGVSHYVSQDLAACKLRGVVGCDPVTDALRCRWNPANECKDASNVKQYVDYYLVMRASNANDMAPAESPFTYTVHIQDGTLQPPGAGCTTLTIPTGYEGTLDNGHYYVVVKGVAGDDPATTMVVEEPIDKGLYQLTVGSLTAALPDAPFSDLKDYASVLSKLQTPGAGLPPIKVIGIQDGTDATVEKQLKSLAWSTATTSVKNTPLVTQISDGGTADSKTVFTTANVGYGITRSIQELAQSLIMDVTVVLDPVVANPGFDIRIEATGTEPQCMGGRLPDNKTWKDCHLTALPNFTVSVENPPAPSSVTAGTYNMTLNVLGKVQIGNSPVLYRTYVVYQIPLTVTATSAGTGGLVFAEVGTYTQTFAASQCLAGETPDWSRLTWSGSIPDGTSLEFKVCTADTEADALTCTTERAAFVTSGSSCTTDAQCPDGFCHNNLVCWYVEGPACTTDDQCGPRGACEPSGMTNTCRWSDLPIDVGAALRGGDNGKRYAKMDVVLRASSNQSAAPTLNEWNIEYDCVPTE